jgi:hypothetical protein
MWNVRAICGCGERREKQRNPIPDGSKLGYPSFMLRIQILLIVTVGFIASPLLALERPGIEFKIFQFPPDKIPRIDGKAEDWDIVPKDYVIGIDQLADTVGGRSGAVETPEGYFIDFGHRDAHGVGDCQFPWHHGAEAAREADVEIVSRPITRVLRVHRLADGMVLDGGSWSADGFLAAARDFFECPPDGLGELTDIFARFAATSPDAVAAALPVRLGPWVEAHVRHPGVGRA